MTTDKLANALAFAAADSHAGDKAVIICQAKAACRTLAAEVARLRSELTEADTAMAKIDSGWPNYREIAAEWFRGREKGGAK